MSNRGDIGRGASASHGRGGPRSGAPYSQQDWSSSWRNYTQGGGASGGQSLDRRSTAPRGGMPTQDARNLVPMHDGTKHKTGPSGKTQPRPTITETIEEAKKRVGMVPQPAQPTKPDGPQAKGGGPKQDGTKKPDQPKAPPASKTDGTGKDGAMDARPYWRP